MQVCYDCLDSKEGADMLTSFEEVKGFVIGPILVQNFAADLVTGSLRLHTGLNQPSYTWGSGFENDVSTVYVRSHPKGRMGLPLDPWETRTVIFRIVDNRTRRSKITVVRMFLVDNVFPPVNQPANNLARDSYGPLSVPVIASSLFSKHRPIKQRELMHTAHTNTGYHLVIPSVASVSSDGALRGGQQSNKSVVAGSHDVAIASYLGVDKVIDRIRRPIERGTNSEWAKQQTSLFATLADSIPASDYSEKQNCAQPTHAGLTSETSRAHKAAEFMYGSKMLCDLSSPAGLLDLMTLDMCTGALPDEFSHPGSIPLALAILTRIAAYPGRFKLDAGTRNDYWAAREISKVFEESNRPIVIATGTTSWSPTDHMFAIDVAAQLAMNNVNQTMLEATRKAHKAKDVEYARQDIEVFADSMETLFHHACTLMIDVAGPTGPDTYSPLFGNASKAVDPITLKRLEQAQRAGLGRLGSRGVTLLRSNNRAQRQIKLLSIMQTVEGWLRDGKVNGVQVCTPNQQNPNTRREPKSVRSGEDPRGFIPVPKYGAKFDIAAELHDVCIDALNTASSQLEILFFRGPCLFFAQQGTEVSLFGAKSKLKCADCCRDMDAIDAFALSTVDNYCCNRCSRPRCQHCLDVWTAMDNCLRCSDE